MSCRFVRWKGGPLNTEWVIKEKRWIPLFRQIDRIPPAKSMFVTPESFNLSGGRYGEEVFHLGYIELLHTAQISDRHVESRDEH
jgi:hypothetical protein